MPQLCLAVSDLRIEGKLFGRNVDITGFVVTLQKKMTQNPNQTWKFSPDGTISTVVGLLRFSSGYVVNCLIIDITS